MVRLVEVVRFDRARRGKGLAMVEQIIVSGLVGRLDCLSLVFSTDHLAFLLLGLRDSPDLAIPRAASQAFMAHADKVITNSTIHAICLHKSIEFAGNSLMVLGLVSLASRPSCGLWSLPESVVVLSRRRLLHLIALCGGYCFLLSQHFFVECNSLSHECIVGTILRVVAKPWLVPQYSSFQ